MKKKNKNKKKGGPAKNASYMLPQCQKTVPLIPRKKNKRTTIAVLYVQAHFASFEKDKSSGKEEEKRRVKGVGISQLVERTDGRTSKGRGSKSPDRGLYFSESKREREEGAGKGGGGKNGSRGKELKGT